MGQISCNGHSFSDSLIPCPYGWKLVSDEKFDLVLDEIVQLVKVSSDFNLEIIDPFVKHGHQAYICPHCGRLLVFFNGIDKPATIFQKG
jgi:hypothetical protein